MMLVDAGSLVESYHAIHAEQSSTKSARFICIYVCTVCSPSCWTKHMGLFHTRQLNMHPVLMKNTIYNTRGTCLSSILRFEPCKARSFPIKAKQGSFELQVCPPCCISLLLTCLFLVVLQCTASNLHPKIRHSQPRSAAVQSPRWDRGRGSEEKYLRHDNHWFPLIRPY